MERQQQVRGLLFGRSAAVVLALAVATVGCGGQRYAVQTVRIPPRLDLQRYGRVGLMPFTVEKAKGSLHELATERFTEEILDAQGGVEVLELRPDDVRVQMAGERELSSAAAREIGLVRKLPAVFAGHLVVSNVKPSGGLLLGLRNPFVEASVSVELTVRLLSAESGGTLWRSSAAATEKVGQLGLSGDEVFFSAKNPNDAYGRLVNHLVMNVTDDLRPTWSTERVPRN